MTVLTVQDRMLAALARVLERDGGLYTLEDLLAELKNGNMQSLAVGNSWAILQVLDYPRKRVVQLRFLVGEMTDLRELYNKIYQFAKDEKADLIRAHGRDGWTKLALSDGWRHSASLFLRDV